MSAAAEPNMPAEASTPPRRLTAVVTATVALPVIVLTAWSAGAPRAEEAQTGMVRWFNHPPQPLAAVFAVVNPLLRPIPLTVLGLLFAGWVVLAAGRASQRWELVRSAVVTLVLAELMAQIGKYVASQPRPLAVVPGIDNHGYPIQPHGNAYPSAHTAVAVALVAGFWPWMRWPQRVVGASGALLIAFNRLYIGAHWPIDIVGGAAIGMLAASIAWLVADRWPIRDETPSNAGP